MKLWIAQGFGVGRIPFAQGTFGSVVGLAWFALLLCARSWLVFALGVTASAGLSVWLCGEAEQKLSKKDPPSVVLDEIIAIPLCFVTAMVYAMAQHQSWPAPAYFFAAPHATITAGVFLLFRLFDIWKPWPVRQSQMFAGGLGITIDDLLAAGYVNLVVCLLHSFVRF
jgi:phosphatidylglycerophosphatase A